MKRLLIAFCALAVVPVLAQHIHEADSQHQAVVAEQGAEVMPFNLALTKHVFTKLKDGGIQAVIARNSGDTTQIHLVREHLHHMQRKFQNGDYSGPTYIHGADMLGLGELKAARPGQIKIAYRDVEDGAELRYQTEDAELVAALHNWFDAQLSDHGNDAEAGHAHTHTHTHTYH
jgi:hypothetical protein